MDFGTNKTPIEIIKEGSFSGTYFQDIYLFILVLMINFIKIVGKKLKNWKVLIKNIIVVIIMSVLINMVLNVVHH